MVQSTLERSNQLSTATRFRSLVFSGSISLAIALPNSDLTQIDTVYLQATRISYLTLLLPRIRAQIEDALEIDEDQIWFSYNGTPLRSHWPIGLLYDCHTSQPTPPATPLLAPTSQQSTIIPPTPSVRPKRNTTPFRISLHLRDPPESLLVTLSLESCRSAFMNRIKESDFVRWGSVKRVTNLRNEQQDALWEGVVQNDEEKYWTVASRLIPLPSAPATHSSPSTSGSTTSALKVLTTSTGRESSIGERLPEGNGVRSVPLRIYLPDGAPVIQDLISPLLEGRPLTLQQHLGKTLPLLFPTPPTNGKESETKASIVIHGIVVPGEMELGWMGSCLAGADGWVSAVLVLH